MARKTYMRDIGEFGLIRRIRGRYSKSSDRVLCGMGDDAATLNLPSDSLTLVTTDTLIEDVHFTLKGTIPYFLGAKALAVNLSDIAAMGGTPSFFLLSLGLPGSYPLSFVDRFYRGVSHVAEAYDVFLVGGDLTAASTFMISAVVIGHCAPDKIIYRKGARPGDHIFVTGPLGDSALGLRILHKRGLGPRDFAADGKTRGKEKDLLGLIRRHLAPPPPVHKGRKIAALGCATSMIDISDGLLADLGHLTEESRVGANLWVDQIPLSRAFKKLAPSYCVRPIDLALGGGEDYELLFTAPRKTVEIALSRSENVDFPVYPVGDVTSHPKKISLLSGNKRAYSPSRLGHDHFRIDAKKIR
ncbi:MAG: thiamine-phosphate kinase [Proteobacteria bacterium]|nr:thiamine-phosphate kinase [Pseudomonadota bacterium]